jgi:L-2-hydroxyglutarate oxidase LhgO
MTDFDVGIIGAGVVGLACAARLGQRRALGGAAGAAFPPGQETSTRNSGVIHAGLYYPTGSLKALLCVEGRELLYRRCREQGIGHRQTASCWSPPRPRREPKLESIFARAKANGAGALRHIDRAEIARLEPRVAASSGSGRPRAGSWMCTS